MRISVASYLFLKQMGIVGKVVHKVPIHFLAGPVLNVFKAVETWFELLLLAIFYRVHDFLLNCDCQVVTFIGGATVRQGQRILPNLVIAKPGKFIGGCSDDGGNSYSFLSGSLFWLVVGRL